MTDIPIILNQLSPPIDVQGQSTIVQQNTLTSLNSQNGTTNPTSLLIPGNVIIPGLAKDIKVGDVINFVLRGRTPEGLGLLYMLGQLVKANVPENIAIGDRVQAKVDIQGNKLLFKILNISGIFEKPKDIPQSSNPHLIPQLTQSISEKLQKEISQLLFKISPYLPNESLHLHAPIQDTKTNFENLAISSQNELISIIADLKKIFLSDKNLSQSSQIEQQLKTANTQEFIIKLKEIQNKINDYITKHTGSSENRFFINMASQLTKISSLFETIEKSGLELPTNKDQVFKETLKLINVLNQELETENLGKTSKKNFIYFNSIKLINTELKELINNSKNFTQNNINKIIDLLTTLQPDSNLVQTKGPSINELRDLHALNNSLEKLISTSDMLSQLEPMMRIMQAPELILFPFLFQGLFSFGEVVIDPNAHRQKNNSNEDEEEKNEEEKNEADKNNLKLYQYTTSIELPNLGLINLSSLQENQEIDIHLNVENDEKKEFILSKLSDLKMELNSIGITARNFVAEAIDISDSILIEE